MGCSNLDAHTQVVEERVKPVETDEGRKTLAITETIVNNRQSLKIALLKLEVDTAHHRRIFIFADDLIPFGKISKTPVIKVLEQHQKIFPEYYQLLQIAERKGIPLVIFNEVVWKREIVMAGLGPRLRRRSTFISRVKDLKKIDQKTLYFSLGGRQKWGQAQNGAVKHPVFDLKLSPVLNEVDLQAFLNLSEISNK